MPLNITQIFDVGYVGAKSAELLKAAKATVKAGRSKKQFAESITFKHQGCVRVKDHTLKGADVHEYTLLSGHKIWIATSWNKPHSIIDCKQNPAPQKYVAPVMSAPPPPARIYPRPDLSKYFGNWKRLTLEEAFDAAEDGDVIGEALAELVERRNRLPKPAKPVTLPKPARK